MDRSRILVWDLPIRLFHWLLVASFIGAFLTADSERYRDLHVLLGYTVVGLLAFRLLWAIAGSRYARLSSFAFGPKTVLTYLRSVLSRRPIHYVGHNPAGSWSIYAIVLLGVLAGISGYAVYVDAGGHAMESLHEGLANAMLAIVIVHVVGVIVSSALHRENLLGAMVTGYKTGKPSDAISRTRWPAAVALACGVAVLWSGVLNAVPDVFTAASSKQPATHRGDRAHLEHDD